MVKVFLQPRGDISESIVPRGFRVLPTDIQEAVDAFFHREEIKNRTDGGADNDQEMSTDTEAAATMRKLRVSDPVTTVLLQRAMHNTLVLATAPRPQDQEELYYECIIEWQAAQWGAASLPGWCPPNFG